MLATLHDVSQTTQWNLIKDFVARTISRDALDMIASRGALVRSLDLERATIYESFGELCFKDRSRL